MQQSSNPGVKWGIIAGVVLILLNVLSWIGGTSMMFSFWNGIFQLALIIVFAVLAGKESKKQAGGYIGFKDLLKPLFTTFIIGTLLMAVFQFIQFKFIDPKLADALRDHTLSTTESLLRRFGAPQEEIDKQLDSISATDFGVTPAKSLMNYLKGLIFYFAVSAIIALILRKKAPEGLQKDAPGHKQL
ncbi:DUF4199 domain-containing protein [Chitinophaga qingshengii]|uniref:DUF4199 domain-containing protein n=1 Tax=Chitinophaga qingshengii TaxID=1569794 RepID=A0ABR7TIV7_9BACT|nr:DUF4199 domain-containing protein [Chitinophaga qingshengii]MBC9929575.1 DUF4199 domain-containing protein [Chitinophaga qingshengii]